MSRFVSDSVVSLALSLLNRALGIGVGIVLARYLGPAGKGYIAYAAIVLQVFTTALNGVSQAVTYQAGVKGLPAEAVYRAMLRLVAAIAIPAIVVVCLIAWFVPAQASLLWVAAALPFAIYVQTTAGIMVAMDRISQINRQRMIIFTAGNLATVAALVLFHADYRVALAIWVASFVLAAAYTAWVVRPYVSDGSRANRELVNEQITFGFKSGAAQMAGFINMRVDVFVVNAMLGSVSLGTYTLAIGVAEMMWQLSQPICMSSFARIARASNEEAAAFTARVVRHVLAIVAPVAIVAFVVGPYLIPLVYGSAFAETGEALRWLLPGIVAYSIEMPLGDYLMVRLARPGLIVAVQSGSIVLCAGLAVALIPHWGINAAAFATSVTYIGVIAVKSSVFSRATGIPTADLFLVNRQDLRALIKLAGRMLQTAGARTRVGRAA